MRKFKTLLFKELRELLTPQVLVPFVVIIAMFSIIGDIVGSETEKTIVDRTVAVVDLDRSDASAAVLGTLEEAGFTLKELPEDAAEDMSGSLAGAARVGIVVPEGFGEGMAAGEPQELRSYAVVRDFSLASMRHGEELQSVLAAVDEGASAQLISRVAPAMDPDAVRRPVRVVEHVVVGDRTAVASVGEVAGFVSSQTTFIPIVLFMVIMFASQMIATTIATEKENKTLETLLSVPISRISLVVAKMVAAGLVALLSAAVYMVGMRNYMEGITGVDMGGAASDALSELGLTLGTGDYVLLGTSLFFGILAALGIAVLLGAFAENVKAVQSLLAPLIILIMVPYFLTMFVDIGSASTLMRLLIYAIPFSHPFMAAPNLFLDNTMPVLAGIAYQALWFALFAFLAARIFSSDKILTMKLRLGRRR